jgi:hypothetical protein
MESPAANLEERRVDAESDRRVFPRTAIFAEAELELLAEGQLVMCRASNISLGGACLEVPLAVHVGGTVFVTVGGIMPPVVALVHVVDTTLDHGKDSASLHVRFHNLTGGNRDRVQLLIESQAA